MAAWARTWLVELRGGEGRAVAAHRHLIEEQNLAATAEGVAAVGRLLGRLPATPGAPLGWYLDGLRDGALGLTCQGPPARPDFPDACCRLVAAKVVVEYLARKAPGLPVDDMGEVEEDRLSEWVADVLCVADPERVLDGDQEVRGRLPVAFVAPEVEVRALLPGTDAARICQALGLSPGRATESHVLLLFRRTEAGPHAVPTAFDAGGDLYFRSPSAGAGAGRTVDQADPPGPGVPEVVVRPFPARVVRAVECL